ncbi:response regulator [Halanaerobium sp. MA284_MarDTE_T2]|uniref:response regulator n=1 Tax=Halanaerobium sp. MA284_MarDTE_T2 TaxID=2183913 RepID=UPI000DF2B144|nr:response regulator [Halanaerobium sp. MA284_MarDTE_T2]RCW48634.1 two-component system response regulator DctR [Halanaerobium sp. MA284_MarDTE_T2]
MDIKVLIVEDDPMVLQINKEFVKKIKGFTVVGEVNSNFKLITKKIKNKKPDLILLDIFLPDNDGIEILKKIRKLELSCDIIFITAASDVDKIHEAFSYGAIDYLIKPFKFERLKKSLEQYLNYIDMFNKNENFTQKNVDKIIYQKKEKKSNELLPKGISEITLKKIYNYLKNKKEYNSANQIAKELGVSRITARKYLEYLAEKNKIQIKLIYGKVGRPTKEYYVDK